MVDQPPEFGTDFAEQLVSSGKDAVYAWQLRAEQWAFFYTFSEQWNEYKRLLPATVLGMAQPREALPGGSADTSGAVIIIAILVSLGRTHCVSWNALQIGVIANGSSTTTARTGDQCCERKWRRRDGDPVVDQGSDLSYCALCERSDESQQTESNAGQESVQQSQVSQARSRGRASNRGAAFVEIGSYTAAR